MVFGKINKAFQREKSRTRRTTERRLLIGGVFFYGKLFMKGGDRYEKRKNHY